MERKLTRLVEHNKETFKGKVSRVRRERERAETKERMKQRERDRVIRMRREGERQGSCS